MRIKDEMEDPKSDLSNSALDSGVGQDSEQFSVLQIFDQVRTDLRFCREWHSRQGFSSLAFAVLLMTKT